MITIILAIFIFCGIISVLTWTILFSAKLLLPQQEIEISVNKEKKINSEPGETLLNILNGNEIYLPSACGGNGTCGVCKCQVIDGGGDILPTELNYISKKQAKDNWRLACQVKAKKNLEIKISEELLSAKKIECEVVSNKNVATFIKELIVKLPDNHGLDFKPGGYVQVQAPPYNLSYQEEISVDKKYLTEWQDLGLMNFKIDNDELCSRAYSIANVPGNENIIKLNVRIATPPYINKKNRFKKCFPGICSSYIFKLKSGDKIDITGPFGDFYIKETDKEMLYIGGGVGMAPLMSHIIYLLDHLKTKRNISFWYGARAVRDLYYIDELERLAKKYKNFDFNLVLSDPQSTDKWNGHTGFVHKAVYNNYLKNHEQPEDIEYYLCGPPLMVEAVNKMLYDLGVEPDMISFDDFG